MSMLRELLEKAAESEASDIHIKSGQRPFFRIHGKLTETEFSEFSADYVRELVEDILPDHMREPYTRDHEADFSHEEGDTMRFRVNVFLSHGDPALAMRHVKTKIPSLSDLNLPDIMENLALSPRGIIIASGTTGSGKSTTLAALINQINITERRRVITIEDPIEYYFHDDLSIISQREVGLDTGAFRSALKHVMRQDPDVIMIGEMRDMESFMAALAAAETGHLVLTTLHSGTANQSINRILDFYPVDEQNQIRMALAGNLRAVVCQRLVPSIEGGVVPAVEIMLNTPTVRKLMEKNQLDVLAAAIETGTEDGMQTFNQSIYKWIKSGKITEEEGLRYASNPETLKMNLKGIFLDESRRILGA
ncbi:MAG: PilT/PilU family type 4a pilus ATPase [Kiritimatiellae bacterium]|nr:PilT/PilU family type 4a pilus ATPase [Kiritimatiellia bacterium]